MYFSGFSGPSTAFSIWYYITT